MEKQEKNAEYAGIEFAGIASDVVGEVLKERNAWKTVAVCLSVAVIILIGTLAAVIMM